MNVTKQDNEEVREKVEKGFQNLKDILPVSGLSPRSH